MRSRREVERSYKDLEEMMETGNLAIIDDEMVGRECLVSFSYVPFGLDEQENFTLMLSARQLRYIRDCIFEKMEGQR